MTKLASFDNLIGDHDIDGDFVPQAIEFLEHKHTQTSQSGRDEQPKFKLVRWQLDTNTRALTFPVSVSFIFMGSLGNSSKVQKT